jgi:very-short-patch-repair endonuclease
MSDQEEISLEQALKFATDAIQKGDVQVGRRALLWILQRDPWHIASLLWFAYITEDVTTKIKCYQRVLQKDPDNKTAIQGLNKYQVSTEKMLERVPPRSEAGFKELPITDLEIIEAAEDLEETENPVKAKLDVSRRDLLDLSLWNKLINFKPLKTKGVEIIDELPEEIYRILVIEGRSMTFIQTPEKEVDKEAEQILLPTLEDEEIMDFGQPDEVENGLAARHTDDKLQTPYTSPILQKRLLSTYYAARTYIEEQGVNILFLALGMLKWFESASSDIERQAPLLLIPVELSRSNVKSKFRVRFTEDEIGENLSLRYKLQTEFNIKLPDFPEEDEIDVKEYFKSISKATSSQSRWEVDGEAITLGFFSFGKFLMFNDLDSSNWPEQLKPEIHPILSGLLEDGFEPFEDFYEEDIDIDEIIRPDEIHHVVDADSSQSMAIYEANLGRNLVIQGPPGTGKSQTITNLIAESIGNHKTVLFVSEKMAALEVVKRRLDYVDLGAACLELHSQKTKKKLVLDELEKSINLGRPKLTEAVDINELKRNQHQLNGYSKAVNEEIGESRLTPHEVYGRLIQVKETFLEQDLPDLDIPSVEHWDYRKIQEAIAKVEQLQVFLSKIGRPIDHPFWGSRLELILPSTLQQIGQSLAQAEDSHNELIRFANKFADKLMIAPPSKHVEIETLIANATYLLSMPDLNQVNVDNEVWAKERKLINSNLERGKRLLSIKTELGEILTHEAWETDVSDLNILMLHYASKWWRALARGYRQARKKLSEFCIGEAPKSIDDQLHILRAILEFQELKPEFEQFDSMGKALFGGLWQGNNSDWSKLRTSSDWLFDLHEKVGLGELHPQLIQFAKTIPDLTVLESEVEQLRLLMNQYGFHVEEVIQSLELDQSLRFGSDKTFINLLFSDQSNLIQFWITELDRLQETVTLRSLQEDLLDMGLESIVTVSLKWSKAGVHLVDLFRYEWLSELIQRALIERPILASFDAQLHELSMQRFCDLDTKLLTQNRIRLALEHWRELPKHEAGGQLGILRHEFAKKRRHKPFRRLLHEAGNVIQVIKPVFMMSPLSIAMFLAPGSLQFDLVIFDEASQVKPVDAFGAIIRGKQLIVVGDDRQLPPTTFFESAIDVDDDYTESVTVDLESILGLCLARGIPQRMLRWHYRSQHESLITVSNYEFYDDKLVVFPSPDHDKEVVGLVYHYLPETEYGRGKSRTNVCEAKAVADAVMRHVKTSPEFTLGVAAFSISQMEAIRDQVEILRRQDPDCEPFFRAHPEEPFFVKNLENVQGDERDVILISVGYGRTAEGKVSMNFGPLNQEGGERRLNVLITRARKRCEVFTNLTAEDIDLNRTKARGVQVLKRFLKYAETGQLDLPIPSGGEAESPFEQAVADKLTASGYRIEHQVGTGGFFIDLAVIDEDKPGRYLLGIECDGAMYHSARSARDRDRLRQEVLENLGWQIHRIWSTDWFRNPERELKNVIARIEQERRRLNNAEKVDEKPFNENSEVKQQIERERPRRKNPAVSIKKYSQANLDIRIYKDTLHEVPRSRLAEWIRQVVNVEGPVHVDEVARRIVNCAGVKRMGRRIRTNYDIGLDYAMRNGYVIKKGKFLWKPGTMGQLLRSRETLPDASRKLELIAPEEIAEAIEFVVKSSYGIERDAISPEVCQIFGFQRTTEGMSKIVNREIGKMISGRRLIEQGDYLTLPE